MKLYQDYKTQFNLIFLGLVIFSFIFSAVFSYAQTAEELQSTISQKNADIAKLEEEIKVYQNQLNDLGKQKSSLSGSLQQLDITRKKLVANISLLEDKIYNTNLKISSLSSDISVKQDSISTNQSAIELGIRSIDQFEQENILETILSKDDFTVAWNDVDNILTLRDKLRENVSELSIAKDNLQNVKDETTAARNDLLKLKSDLADQKKIVDQNAAEKNKLLAQTKNSEVNYQKLLANQMAKKLAIEKELRDYESKLQFILDPSKLPPAGVLSWPLDNILVTQQFGKTVDSVRLYASGSHSGTDFRASVGTPVKAMENGVVIGAGNTDITCAGASFGQWVLVQYNNGLSSTFGHLSLIKVQAGQTVSRGEVVAYSGSTGHVTGPHLHVSLYVSSAVKVQTLPSIACPGKILTQPIAPINAYLDPMHYLPPYQG